MNDLGLAGGPFASIEPTTELANLPPEWTFRSEITTPSGVRFEVTVTVPEDVADSDVMEYAEIAADHATRLAWKYKQNAARHADGAS